MTATTVAVLFTSSVLLGQTGLKVFISVDMEGISGVVNWEDVSRDGKDYPLFREIMTTETNAAIEGAVAAGAKEIVVRDSHGTARNIIPTKLDRRAKLLRDWSGGPMGMMEGIDASFDAVIFIGYHAKAGTADATLDHTQSSSRVNDVSINGISLPEAGINALVAGHYNVPVVFVAGDRAICNQVKALFGTVDTFAVKEGMGNAALCLHPELSHEKIREGVTQALSHLNSYKPYTLKAPYTLVVRLLSEQLVHEGSFFPGVKRTGDWELTFTSNNLIEVINTFRWLY